MEGDEMNEEEIGEEEIDDAEVEEEFCETIRYLLIAIQIILFVLREHIHMMHRRINRSLKRRPISNKGYQYINGLMSDDPENFKQLYRMYPHVFLKLCSIIRESALSEDIRYICVEEMLATFLLIVGHNDRYYNVRQRVGRSRFVIRQNFNKTLKALNTIAPNMMIKPGSAVPSKVRKNTRFYPYFKDCIGAIDGTHIPIMIKGRQVSSYRNRHGIQSQNVLAACNFDLEFIYVLSGWEGSVHDSKLLNDALLRRNGLEVHQGKYFLVNYGFANQRQFLALLRGVRYHLKDFGGQGRHPRNAREMFNFRHAKLRNVIERIFGIIKSWFTIFKIAPSFPFQTQAELVLACAGLHNFLRKECHADEFLVEPEDDLSPSYLDMADENLELLSQSQLRQREEANAWRLTIAQSLWDDRPRDDEDDENEEDDNDNQGNQNAVNEEYIDNEDEEDYHDNEVDMNEYTAF